jgi:hypothetical protein
MLDQISRFFEAFPFVLLMFLYGVINTLDGLISPLIHPAFPVRVTLSFLYAGERYDFSRVDMLHKRAEPSGGTVWDFDHHQITVPLHDGSALIVPIRLFLLSPVAQNGLEMGKKDVSAITMWHWLDNRAQPTRIVEANFSVEQLKENGEAAVLIGPHNAVRLTLERLASSFKKDAEADKKAYAEEINLDSRQGQRKFYSTINALRFSARSVGALRQLPGWSTAPETCKVLLQSAMTKPTSASRSSESPYAEFSNGAYLGSSTWRIEKRSYPLTNLYLLGEVSSFPSFPSMHDFIESIEFDGHECHLPKWDTTSNFMLVDFETSDAIFEIRPSEIRSLIDLKSSEPSSEPGKPIK